MRRLDAKKLLHLSLSRLAPKNQNADAVINNRGVRRVITLRVGLVHVLQPNEGKQQKPIPRQSKKLVSYLGERHRRSQI